MNICKKMSTEVKEVLRAETAKISNEFHYFIIGKMWTTSNIPGRTGGSIKINRDMPGELVLKADDLLTLTPNNKREEYQDADYSVSVLLPAAIAGQWRKEQDVLKAKREANELATKAEKKETL